LDLKIGLSTKNIGVGNFERVAHILPIRLRRIFQEDYFLRLKDSKFKPFNPLGEVLLCSCDDVK